MGRLPRQTTSISLLLGLLLVGMGCTNSLNSFGQCEDSSQCTDGAICVDGYCAESETPECQIDGDCLGGLCINGVCRISGIVDSVDGGTQDAGQYLNGDGVIQISPNELLDFGSPVLGVALTRVIHVINVGDGLTTFENITRDFDTSDEFTWVTDPELPAVLYPEDQVEVTILYALSDGEEDVGTLFLETNAESCNPECNDPQAIPVELFSEFKGARNLSLTPEEHDFGYVPVGNDSPAYSMVLTNDGTLDKVLTIESLSAEGDVDAFSYELPALPVYLAPGASYEIPVVYSPDSASTGQSVTFTATANSDAPENRVLSAIFYATSQPPNALVFDPYELIFNEAVIGQTQQLSSILSNQGGVPIQVTSLELAAHQPVEYSFFPSVTLPYTLAPGASLDVFVDFTAVSGAPSATTISALNDQASGDVPVLSIRGESYIPPGGPIVDVSMGPETLMDSDCACQATGNVPAANVDISYQAIPGGPTCSKPANPGCGVGGSCDCSTMSAYGDLDWSGSRIEEVRGETWIVDEQVHHEGDGLDGQFRVTANLLDNCLAVPGSTEYSVNHACCMWIDCESPGPQACLDYGSTSPLCASSCLQMAGVTSQDCLARGPVAIRTSVHIYGNNFDETRYFCVTLDQNGANQEVVTLNREAGYFQIDSVAAGVTEVNAGQTCP
jgi:hypothetical protein